VGSQQQIKAQRIAFLTEFLSPTPLALCLFVGCSLLDHSLSGTLILSKNATKPI
jgi:hypothetical protein